MAENYFEDKTFENIDFSKESLPKGEYEACTFRNCNFENFNLSHFKYIDCSFEGCNLSLAKLGDTVLRDIKFKNSKMLGLRFDHCSEFGLSFSFDNCQLDHSVFSKLKLKTTVFNGCTIVGADFSETDLSAADFSNTNLTDSVFDRTILEKADFRTAFNYSIDPEANRIKKARFSFPGVVGLLNKYDIKIDGI